MISNLKLVPHISILQNFVQNVHKTKKNLCPEQVCIVKVKYNRLTKPCCIQSMVMLDLLTFFAGWTYVLKLTAAGKITSIARTCSSILTRTRVTNLCKSNQSIVTLRMRKAHTEKVMFSEFLSFLID